MIGYRTTPLLYINGQKVPKHLAQKAKPNQTLLSFLRDVMKLTGSKLGCAEGGCGACTVMISRYDNTDDITDDTATATDTSAGVVVHYAVNACLMPVLAADGCHITTVEGVGSVTKNRVNTNNAGHEKNDDGLHPIQKAMVDMHGSQCGRCLFFLFLLFLLFQQQ